MTSESTTFLFSGYARLPQDVSHQAMYKRVGVVLEADQAGVVVFPGMSASRWGAEPSASMTKSSERWVRVVMKAMNRPSGDQAGFSLAPSPWVS